MVFQSWQTIYSRKGFASQKLSTRILGFSKTKSVQKLAAKGLLVLVVVDEDAPDYSRCLINSQSLVSNTESTKLLETKLGYLFLIVLITYLLKQPWSYQKIA